MRKVFALMLIALLLGVGVVALIEKDPGYLLLAYGEYTLESSLWVGLLLVMIFTGLLYGVTGLLRSLIGGQKSLSGWLGSRRARQAAQLTDRGMVHFIEGNWSKARSESLRAARNNDTPLLNYLVAAGASAHLGANDEVEQYLEAAAESGAGVDTTVALARAEIRLQGGHYQLAIDALKDARRSPGQHPRVLALLQRAYTALGDSAGLAELLPLLRKYQTYSSAEQQRLEREVYCRQLQSAGDTARDASLDTLTDVWQKIPSAVQEDVTIACHYADRLVALGGHAAAEKVLLRILKHEWNPEAVRIFGCLQSDNPGRQLTRAESWLEDHPEDADLLLCLGRLSAREKLWGKSRDYFEKSYRVRCSTEVCAELGRLLSGLGEANLAAAYFREGLLLGETHLPELPSPETAVG